MIFSCQRVILCTCFDGQKKNSLEQMANYKRLNTYNDKLYETSQIFKILDFWYLNQKVIFNPYKIQNFEI